MTNTNCRTLRSKLPDLLLDPAFLREHPEMEAHLASCTECREELKELQATFALLDTWKAPEPTAFFDTRLKARLQEVAAEPVGFWERTKAWWMYSTSRSLRPALAGALAVAMVAVGSGVFANMHTHPVTAPQTSATVDDLKVLDNNAQALQQMDQLLDASNDDGDAQDSPTT